MALLTQLHPCMKKRVNDQTESKRFSKQKAFSQVQNVPFLVPTYPGFPLSRLGCSSAGGGGHCSLLLALLFFIPASSILPSHPLLFFLHGWSFPSVVPFSLLVKGNMNIHYLPHPPPPPPAPNYPPPSPEDTPTLPHPPPALPCDWRQHLVVAHGETAVAKRARHLCGGRAGGEEKRERERESRNWEKERRQRR